MFVCFSAYACLQYLSEVPRPVCSPNGYYAAVQYSAGKAYCADRNGNRIEDYELPMHEAGNMNCSKFTRFRVMVFTSINNKEIYMQVKSIRINPQT